jgi:hypothetical protein
VSANGEKIIKIGRMGRTIIQLGDDETGIRIAVDAVRTYNAWLEVSRAFQNEQGVILPENRTAANTAMYQFVKGIFTAALAASEQGGAVNLDDLTEAESNCFLARITEEVMRLRTFFEINLPEKPSSQESTQLRFGT